MIIPEKKEDPNKNYYAVSATFTVCLIFYVGLVFASVTDPDSKKITMAEVTELNITRFQPNVPEPEVIEEPEEPVAQEESPAETETQEVNTPQRVDMSEVLPEGVQVDLSVSRAPNQTSQSRSATQNNSRSLRLEESEMEEIGGLNTLSGGEISTPQANRRRSISGDGGSEGGIGLAEGPEISAGNRGITDGGGTGGLLSGPEVREGNTQGREVGLKNLNDFGDGYSDMDPILNNLIEWMKENPADLPAPVESVMDERWDPNYLTSRVPFTIQDRQFDLLLMVKEADLEVHIFLVENKDEATYLIDSGFQRQSNSMRRGNVDYHNSDIVDVGSEMRAAGTQQTQEFYQIFLSWWESVETEME